MPQTFSKLLAEEAQALAHIRDLEEKNAEIEKRIAEIKRLNQRIEELEGTFRNQKKNTNKK
jgi:hypothetical protein